MCVCEAQVGGSEGKEASMHGFLLRDLSGISKGEKKKNIPSISLGVSSHATQKQLCSKRALPVIHNVFCWWIKVEEAKYLAQIYAWGLTLGTNHPQAKSLFPVTHWRGERRG